MYLKQKSIRSLKKVLGPLVPRTRFRVVAQVEDLSADALTRAGFDAHPQAGDTILPSVVGSTTRFNAEGREVVRKDLPKEERYITTVEWSWEEWAGRGSTETRTEDRAIFRPCYPRDFIEPPAAEISIVEHGGAQLVVSEELVNESAQEERIQHIINVFLELFGECEIRHANLQTLTPPNTRKVNWALLPPGQYPWSRVRGHVERILDDKDPRYANPVYRRLETIAAYNPDEVYVGHGGFRTYVAYVFRAKKIAILESVMLNNATYVFGQDWQRLSQMTKAEILRNDLQLDRIIHTNYWAGRISKILK